MEKILQECIEAMECALVIAEPTSDGIAMLAEYGWEHENRFDLPPTGFVGKMLKEALKNAKAEIDVMKSSKKPGLKPLTSHGFRSAASCGFKKVTYDPETMVFEAVHHDGRVLVSCDMGITWSKKKNEEDD